MSKTLEADSVEPAALSPKGTCAYLSLSKRSVSTLIADGVLIAKRAGGRRPATGDRYWRKAAVGETPDCGSMVIPKSILSL